MFNSLFGLTGASLGSFFKTGQGFVLKPIALQKSPLHPFRRRYTWSRRRAWRRGVCLRSGRGRSGVKGFTRMVCKTFALRERYRFQPIVQEKVYGVAKGHALHCYAATRRWGWGLSGWRRVADMRCIKVEITRKCKFELLENASMCWSKTIGNGLARSSVVVIFGSLAACAQLPQSMADQGWTDLWGDRGQGVLARDYQMCAELVEQRRGLLAGCMESRGWQIK